MNWIPPVGFHSLVSILPFIERKIYIHIINAPDQSCLLPLEQLSEPVQDIVSI